MSAPDRLASRGALLTILGMLAVPGTVALVALVPESGRKFAFFTGLVVAAALSMMGGLSARSALVKGTGHPGRAWFGALAGLTVGVTAGLFLAWSLLAAVL